jgi:hypothetical protein
MATLLVDNFTVGPAPLTVPPLADATLPPATWEFRPSPLTSGDLTQIGPNANFITTYQPFSLTVTAIPTAPLEVINGLTITLKYCICEDPLPGVPTTRSLDAKLNIKASPYWLPGLFFEPLVLINPGIGGSPAIISGYFTERNWYDREIVVSYLNVITKFTSDGFFYAPLENFPKNLPFDLSKIKIPLPSGVNVNTFYPLSIGAAYTTESEILEPYFKAIGQVVSYKGTDIKKLRFFFDVVITSNFGVYPSTAYMIVQYNQKAANERLKFLLSRRRKNAILNITQQENFELE